MSTPYSYSIRLVIQQIRSGRDRRYRVMGYSGKRALAFSEFDSERTLMNALDTNVPGFFELDFLRDASGGADHHVIFAGEMELSYRQLSGLGLC